MVTSSTSAAGNPRFRFQAANSKGRSRSRLGFGVQSGGQALLTQLAPTAISRASACWRQARASQSHPNENRSAAQTCCIRRLFKLATRLPRRTCEIVTALCRFTAHRPFIPSSTSSTTSEGTSRTVEVIGATVTVDRWLTAPSRVSMSTGRCLSGRSNRQRWTAPRFNLPAKPLRPPTVGIPLSVAV